MTKLRLIWRILRGRTVGYHLTIENGCFVLPRGSMVVDCRITNSAGPGQPSSGIRLTHK